MAPSQVIAKKSHFFSTLPRAGTKSAAQSPPVLAASATNKEDENLKRLQESFAAASAKKSAAQMGTAVDVQVKGIRHVVTNSMYGSGMRTDVTYRIGKKQRRRRSPPVYPTGILQWVDTRDIAEPDDKAKKEKSAKQLELEKQREELETKRAAVLAENSYSLQEVGRNRLNVMSTCARKLGMMGIGPLKKKG